MKRRHFKIILMTDVIHKDGFHPLALRVTINSKVKKYRLGVKVNPKDWNPITEKIKGDIVQTNNIHKKKSDLINYCYTKENAGIIVSFDIIKSYFNEIDYNNFYDVFDLILSQKKICENTRARYNLLRKYLKEFKGNLMTCDVNYTFIKSFDIFLEKKNAGAYNHHKCLKSILEEAVKHDFIYKSPYLKFTFKSPESKNIFLERSEVVKIKNLKFDDEYRVLRDIFLLYCYTGLRYSDVRYLKLRDIDFKKNLLEITMDKGGEILTIPMSSEARGLLCKYCVRRKNNEFVFPDVCNQKMNSNLKKIAKLAGINKNITCHVGRHTFASNLSNIQKLSLPVISKFLGHKNIANTSIYTNSNLNTLRESIKEFRYELKS